MEFEEILSNLFFFRHFSASDQKVSNLFLCLRSSINYKPPTYPFGQALGFCVKKKVAGPGVLASEGQHIDFVVVLQGELDLQVKDVETGVFVVRCFGTRSTVYSTLQATLFRSQRRLPASTFTPTLLSIHRQSSL